MKPNSPLFTLSILVVICFGSLSVVATTFNPSAESIAVLQATATCASQSTPTPVSSCPSENPAPVLGRQPQPIAMVSAFMDAGLNRLGDGGPALPSVWQGYDTQAQQVTPYVPCILLEAMAYTESTGWKQFNASYNGCGFTKIGVDPNGTTCGYGIMQITSGMGGDECFIYPLFTGGGPSTVSLGFVTESIGKVVSSNNGEDYITADRNQILDWELFIIEYLANGKVALLANNGKYVSSNNGSTYLKADRTSIGSWEQFTLIRGVNGDSYLVALKASNNKYVSFNHGSQHYLKADASSIGTTETFRLVSQ